MTSKSIYFDLDGTLVDTTSTLPYRTTRKGRSFVANNIGQFNLKPYSKDLIKFVNDLAKHYSVSILTNSDLDVASALIQSLSLSSNIQIIASAEKPYPSSLSGPVTIERFSNIDPLVVGDSAKDVLVAHLCQVPSIAVEWGMEFDQGNMVKAQPTSTASTMDDLMQKIDDFCQHGLPYVQQSIPQQNVLNQNFNLDPQLEIRCIDDYYPPSSYGNNIPLASKIILAYKKSKNFRFSELKKGQLEYYYGYSLCNSGKLIDSVNKCYQKLIDALRVMNFNGSTLILAAPNSSPEYCYMCDINQILVGSLLNIKEPIPTLSSSARQIFRIKPKPKATTTGVRSYNSQRMSLGYNPFISLKYDNIVIFDDVTTTGSQLNSIGIVLRNLGFQGNLYAMALGDTK